MRHARPTAAAAGPTRRAVAALVTAAGLAAATLPACTPGRAGGTSDSPQAVRQAIEAEIARSLDATRRQDIDAYMSGFAPDLQIVGPDGRTHVASPDQLRANMLRDWSIIPATRDLWMRVDSLGSVGGDSAVVYTSQRWDRLMLQRDGVTRDTVVTTQLHRELWRRTAAGWRRARVEELGGTIHVNGQPYTPPRE